MLPLREQRLLSRSVDDEDVAIRHRLDLALIDQRIPHCGHAGHPPHAPEQEQQGLDFGRRRL